MDTFAKFYFFVNTLIVVKILHNVFIQIDDKRKREELKKGLGFYLLFNFMFGFLYFASEALAYLFGERVDNDR